MHLEPHHIQRLNQYLTKHGLAHTEVKADLLDHICIEIEFLMESGKPLEQALSQTLDAFPPEEIKEIQSDTTYYLTIKSTLAMIKGIFISAYLCVSFFALSLGLEGFFAFVTRDPELVFMLSSLLKLASVVTFCFVFLPLLFLYGYRRFTANLAR